MSSTAYASATVTTWPAGRVRTVSWARAKLVVLAVAAAAALGFRVIALSTYGLSEDEINKVRAIEHYRSGDFTSNAEHPMLMKLAMWASVDLRRAWNRAAGPEHEVSLETAIRLPNAIAGAATTLALFGIADLLFGGAVATAAAFIWAFDVNAIAINRIGKEDTFLLLFFLIAVLCYERAKRGGVTDPAGAQRWYTLSGAAFGLMLASKYMPHFLGIYALFNTVTDPQPGANKPNRIRHYAAMGLAFVIANAAILMPATWRYAVDYVQGGTLVHHGFLYAGSLYVNDIPVSPLGVPAAFYLRLLATKVPLVLLAAAVPGVIELVRRRRERGYVLLRVLLVFVLVPYSLMAAKFLRYALPMLATLDLIAAVGLVAGIGWLLRKGWLPGLVRVTVAAVAIGVFVAGLVASQQTAAPFYSTFQNAVGARLSAPGAVFPEETYDYGVREAVAAIAAVAEPSAAIVSDATASVEHYVRESRPDLAVLALSGSGIPTDPRETWVIVQDEHTTFENQLLVDQLRRRARPWAQFHAGGALATQVFRLPGSERCTASW